MKKTWLGKSPKKKKVVFLLGITSHYPWCRNIYLQNWVIFGVNVGKYSSTMEHLGIAMGSLLDKWKFEWDYRL